jgi:hypothetical protein
MYLPSDPYRKLRDHWRGNCPWGACSQRAAKGACPGPVYNPNPSPSPVPGANPNPNPHPDPELK